MRTNCRATCFQSTHTLQCLTESVCIAVLGSHFGLDNHIPSQLRELKKPHPRVCIAVLPSQSFHQAYSAREFKKSCPCLCIAELGSSLV